MRQEQRRAGSRRRGPTGAWRCTVVFPVLVGTLEIFHSDKWKRDNALYSVTGTCPGYISTLVKSKLQSNMLSRTLYFIKLCKQKYF